MRVPREEACDFTDDLTAWASDVGVDPNLTVAGETGVPTTIRSAVYQDYGSNSLFEQSLEWRAVIPGVEPLLYSYL